MRSISIILLCFLLLQGVQAQKNYRVGAIGFYNLENLFDTEDDPLIRDEEFTPTGGKGYNEEIYQDKLNHLTDVVSRIGTDLTPDGLAILGVAEIENRRVLEDFARHPKVADRKYQVIHFDSPDKRGIDVGLLYQPKYFTPLKSRAINMTTELEEGDTLFTRDILLVSGVFDGDTIHVLVNHWPSRRGGEKRSQPLRNMAAMKCKLLIDSLNTAQPASKIILMGDLNDDPVSPSVKDILQAQKKPEKTRKNELYNPMYSFYKKGLGTTAYRDAWSLFDQIIVSGGLLKKRDTGYRFFKARVYNESFLTQKQGQFKGYPLRTYVGDTYMGGYSDHFPVYVFLVKEL